MILTIFVVFLLYIIAVFFWKFPAVSNNKLNVYKECGSILNRIFFYLVPVSLISLIIGLRYDVGVDYLAYKEIYETRFVGGFNESLENIEFLYAVISFCCYKFGMPYYLLFVIMAFIPFYFYYKSFHCFRYLFPYATYFLISLGILFLYLNIQRQAIAFFILLYSVNYIIKKRLFFFLLCCLIAAGFHVTSFYFIPCFLFYYFPQRQLLSSNFLVFVYTLTWLFSSYLQHFLFEMITPFLSGRYATYLEIMNEWEMEGGSGIGLIILHLVDIILILNSSILFYKYRQERFDIYFRIYFVGTIIANIAGVNMVLSRLPFCFTSMKIIVASFFVCYVLSIWRYNNFLKRKFSLVLLVVFTVLLLGANIANTPYCFVFQ